MGGIANSHNNAHVCFLTVIWSSNPMLLWVQGSRLWERGSCYRAAKIQMETICHSDPNSLIHLSVMFLLMTVFEEEKKNIVKQAAYFVLCGPDLKGEESTHNITQHDSG